MSQCEQFRPVRAWATARRWMLWLVVLAVDRGVGVSQDFFKRLQVHGFGTQAVSYSDHNNYLGMNTGSVSGGWTEAAVNVNEQVTERLRLGAQFHVTKLGSFGSYTPYVDWALADYSIRQWLGVRAGKVKIRWGLFNDTQDADPEYLWTLLPEPIYGVDVRSTNLAQDGVELYGKRVGGRHLGSVEYSAYWGYFHYASNDGYSASFAQQGIRFKHPAFGKTPGVDLRWRTPVRGLEVGGSVMAYDAQGALTQGKYVQPLAYWPTGYGQYKYKRFYASGQYVRLIQYGTVTIPGGAPSTTLQDTRSWFLMASYRLLDKLQAGTYFTRYVLASSGSTQDPANYFRDVAVSARYDFSSHVYGKLEGHMTHGSGVGFYTFNNPNGIEPDTRLIIAKVGYTF